MNPKCKLFARRSLDKILCSSSKLLKCFTTLGLRIYLKDVFLIPVIRLRSSIFWPTFALRVLFLLENYLKGIFFLRYDRLDEKDFINVEWRVASYSAPVINITECRFNM